MREPRLTKHFWSNYVAQKPFDIDDLFGTDLKEDSIGVESLDEKHDLGEDFVFLLSMNEARDEKREEIWA
ncbi:hypothetical protein BDY21DRAFT_367970 [Lineolata rhizophorae]|uniref:Uncharacterized protein n=1 Tax=Lineolata rhizophorae TaxID=578093 RepID=A0A6A6PD89_9PEZI|nr:hypothetical protein BDY21DRAFT_367970 [Lineolata rhizophorae]